MTGDRYLSLLVGETARDLRRSPNWRTGRPLADHCPARIGYPQRCTERRGWADSTDGRNGRSGRAALPARPGMTHAEQQSLAATTVTEQAR